MQNVPHPRSRHTRAFTDDRTNEGAYKYLMRRATAGIKPSPHTDYERISTRQPNSYFVRSRDGAMSMDAGYGNGGLLRACTPHMNPFPGPTLTRSRERKGEFGERVLLPLLR